MYYKVKYYIKWIRCNRQVADIIITVQVFKKFYNLDEL